MGKKKKGKSQKKYAAVGGDEQAGKKKNGKKQPPRRSKRARRPVENNSIDDYKFRQEVEGMLVVSLTEYFFVHENLIFFLRTFRRHPNNNQYRGGRELFVWIRVRSAIS